MHSSECTRTCWIFGAITGLVVMVFVSGIGDGSWAKGLFLAFVTFVLVGALLNWLICEGRPVAYDVNAGLKPPPASPPVISPANMTEVSTAPLAPVAAGKSAPVEAPAETRAAPSPKAKAAPRQQAERDDLKQITGIGPKIEEALNALGVTRFAQVAAWTAADAADISQRLGRLGGRVESEDWVGQARALDEARHG